MEDASRRSFERGTRCGSSRREPSDSAGAEPAIYEPGCPPSAWGQSVTRDPTTTGSDFEQLVCSGQPEVHFGRAVAPDGPIDQPDEQVPQVRLCSSTRRGGRKPQPRSRDRTPRVALHIQAGQGQHDQIEASVSHDGEVGVHDRREVAANRRADCPDEDPSGPHRDRRSLRPSASCRKIRFSQSAIGCVRGPP